MVKITVLYFLILSNSFSPPYCFQVILKVGVYESLRVYTEIMIRGVFFGPKKRPGHKSGSARLLQSTELEPDIIIIILRFPRSVDLQTFLSASE